MAEHLSVTDDKRIVSSSADLVDIELEFGTCRSVGLTIFDQKYVITATTTMLLAALFVLDKYHQNGSSCGALATFVVHRPASKSFFSGVI
jgi:hypothetical protein